MALLLLLSGRRCCCSYGSCGLRLGLHRPPVPAASLHRALRPPEPPPWPALRLPACHFSSKANSNKLTSALVSKIKFLNQKYERYLERKFPRFYQLYSTFLKGFQVFFSEAKEIRRIKADMSSKNIQFHQLPYREMERLRQFRRDLIKAIPVGILSLPPFANYFVLLLMYLFPRQLLIRHFWTPKQQAEFLNTYHNMRREVYSEVIDGLTHLSHFPDDPQLRQRMLSLCKKCNTGNRLTATIEPQISLAEAVSFVPVYYRFATVVKGIMSLRESGFSIDFVCRKLAELPTVQEGFHPDVTELKAVRRLFQGHPFGIQQLTVQHVKVLSRVLFLTPRLPSFFLRNRLRSHLSEMHYLDQAMVKLGVSQLTDEEVQVACYTRGLNPVHLDPADCRLWLNQWLSLSCSLRDSETSLLAHAMVLLSTNFAPSSKS